MSLYKYNAISIEKKLERLEYLNEIIEAEIKDSACKALIRAVMNKYGLKFVESVGSAGHHHNYPGGLMEHTLDVMMLARSIGEYYEDKVDMDVLLTGAVLHDIGKIVCYEEAPNLKSGKRPKKEFKRSEDDKVMGHFGESLYILTECLLNSGVDLGIEKERAIYHIIASHHGEARLNWGSMVDPNTNEAYIVALADLLSSRIK